MWSQIICFPDDRVNGLYLLDEPGTGLSPQRLRKQFIVLNNMFKYAVYPKHFLNENPMQYIKKRKKAKPVSLFEIVDFGDQLTQILRRARKEELEEQLKYGPLLHKHYYQEVEIKGRQHVQIFTEISPELECLSCRATKGKFIQDMDDSRPSGQLHFVCAKPVGELLTTQTLKWCNKVVQRNVADMQHFHFRSSHDEKML